MALQIASTTRLDSAAVLDLASRLRGGLIQPRDPSFDDARRAFHGGYDRRPALIVRAADVIDVIRAVNFARDNDLTLAIRSGGHSLAGYSTVEDGLLLDLSGMKGLSIDAERRVARAEPGLTWGEYAAQAQQHGLATTSGDAGTVGVGGLALGGGIGWLVRKYGLTIDHLLSAELVTADGRLVRASEQENADLFWALRGGGGNFGVATSFELKLQPVGTVLGGAVIYAGSEARQVLRGLADYAVSAPDGLTTISMVLPAPPLPFLPAALHGEPIVVIGMAYTGDLEAGERAIAPLRQFGTPLADLVQPMPYPGLFAMTDALVVKGLPHAMRSSYLDSFGDDLVDLMAAFGEQARGQNSMLQLRVLGGQMARVSSDATAFAHRDKRFMLSAISVWNDPAVGAQSQAWLRRFWTAVRPKASGVYVNFLEEEGESRIREAYSQSTYARLTAVKAHYDPTNFFRMNQNIRPAR